MQQQAGMGPCGPRHLGRSQPRVEDRALLTGRGRFGDDAPLRSGTLHAAVLRSPHAHARLLALRTEAALALPGVRAVLVGEDVRRWSRPFISGVKQPMELWALAVDKVRYVGEPVAVVVAESRYLAEDALDCLEADYQPLPAVADIRAAIAAEAPLLHEAVGSNVVSDRSFRYGDPEAAFAAAPHRVDLSIDYPRNSCTPIEGAVVLAEFISEQAGYEIQSNFMGPFSLHTVMAMALKVPGNQLRHRIFPDSGGSFGVKQAVMAPAVLMCLASRKAGAPVKWVEDRLEHLSAATSATARLCHASAAVEADGRITALALDQFDDCGGYLRAPEPATFYRMHGCLTGAYDVRHLSVRNRVVLTSKTPTGLVRGFGGPQVYFALERLVQRIAVELGLDPLQVYRRNLIPADAFPYRAAAGALIDSGNYQQALRLAVEDGGLAALRERQRQARAQGRLYGIGLAAIVEPSVSNMGYITTVLPAEQRARAGPKNGAIASATVFIDPLGGVNVVIASAPAGQGHRTVCAQVAADAFGLRPADIQVNTEFDTAKDAWSVAAGNYSSRFAGAVAGTLHLACERLRSKLARLAAAQWGCDAEAVVFAGGLLHPAGEPGRGLPFARFAASPHWAPALLPDGEDASLRETAFWTPPQLAAPDEQDRVNTSAAYGFVFDLCAVEVERATGRVRVDRYVTVHDAGRILNPALADGQIRGAFAQGLGAALMEEFRYGADGSFQSGTFADYLVPTACEVPDPVILHLETPSPFTPLGAKGLGEGNNMSTPVCIANAVADALGRADITLPMTPSRVMAMLGVDDPPPSASRAAGISQGISSDMAPDMTRNIAPGRADAAAHEAPGAVPALGGKGLSARGEVLLSASPEAVFAVLLDPVALARVVPGCQALEAIAPQRYRAEVTLGIGLVKARYAAEIELSEIDAPHRLRLAGAGLSSLGSARGSGLVTLEPCAGGTLLRYDYQAEVSGKVAAVGGRMLEGAARMVLKQLFEQLGRQAGAAESATIAPAAMPANPPAPLSAPPSWWRRLLARLGGPR